MARKDSKNFEQNLERLETIVDQLEEGETSLDDALKLFEEGVKTVRQCNKVLEDAERKVQVLMGDEENGFSLQEFDEKEDE